MNSCFLASGEILGRRVADKLTEPESLEELLSQLREKAKAYLSFEYEMLARDRAVLRIRRSAFWEVIKGTAIDKIKNVACDSEFRFIEAALKRHFSAGVERRRCYRKGSHCCEFVVRIRR